MLRSLCFFGLMAFVPTQLSAEVSRSCEDTIREYRQEIDCQTTEAVQSLVWPEAHELYNLVLSGPCPTYRTYLREVRAEPVQASRQIVRLKEIVTKVSADGRYSGDYSVYKSKYVCHYRQGEWRISDRQIISRFDGVNQEAVRQFRRTGG